MHRYSLIFHTLSKFKNIASKKKASFFFFCYLAQCSVTEAKYLHNFIMKCHFSFAFSQKFPRENQYLNWRAVYPLTSAPRIGSNAKAKENLSDSEARCVSHQLGKFRVGCHAGFAGVMLNQGQLPSVWLRFELRHTARTRPMQTHSLHLQLSTGTAVCLSLLLQEPVYQIYFLSRLARNTWDRSTLRKQRRCKTGIKEAAYLQ